MHGPRLAERECGAHERTAIGVECLVQKKHRRARIEDPRGGAEDSSGVPEDVPAQAAARLPFRSVIRDGGGLRQERIGARRLRIESRFVTQADGNGQPAMNLPCILNETGYLFLGDIESARAKEDSKLVGRDAGTGRVVEIGDVIRDGIEDVDAPPVSAEGLGNVGAVKVETKLHVMRASDNREVVGELQAGIVLLDRKEGNAAEKAASADLNLRADHRLEVWRFAVVQARTVLKRILPAKFVHRARGDNGIHADVAGKRAVPFGSVILEHTGLYAGECSV